MTVPFLSQFIYIYIYIYMSILKLIIYIDSYRYIVMYQIVYYFTSERNGWIFAIVKWPNERSELGYILGNDGEKKSSISRGSILSKITLAFSVCRKKPRKPQWPAARIKLASSRMRTWFTNTLYHGCSITYLILNHFFNFHIHLNIQTNYIIHNQITKTIKQHPKISQNNPINIAKNKIWKTTKSQCRIRSNKK